MGIVERSATGKVNTGLNLLSRVKRIRQEDKRFIKVSPSYVGVKNDGSGIVQSGKEDRARISNLSPVRTGKSMTYFPQISPTQGFFVIALPAYAKTVILQS